MKNQAITSYPLFFDPLNKKVAFFDKTGMAKFGYIDEREAVKIHDNGDVEFCFFAPNAKKVQVSGLGGSMTRDKIDLEKEESGYFSKRVSNIKPGFHYHDWFVDDVLVRNPLGMFCYGCFESINFYEKPNEDDFYFMKDVPHGDVRMEQYNSSINNRTKQCYVYTPPGYYENSNKKYPVLYIQHGVGENETGWIWNGKANFIMDNLIHEGKCKEMILVMNCGYAFKKDEDPIFYPGDFDGQLINDCIPFIENNFRVSTERNKRAIAGLSLGSVQATLTAVKHSHMFSALGVFSGVLTSELDKVFENNLNFDYIFLSAGKEEKELAETISKYKIRLDEYKINNNVQLYEGHHEWSPWRESLRDFACEIFKCDDCENLEKNHESKEYDNLKINPINNENKSESIEEADNMEPNQALEHQMLFYDPVYRQVIFEFNEDGTPAGKYKQMKHGVEIIEQGKAKFNFFAPNAEKVEVKLLGNNSVEMEKEEDNYWSVVINNIEPGLHYHEYLVNGTQVINPWAPLGYGCFKAINFFEMPELDFKWYLLNDVPHGTIHLNYYKSSQTGRMKGCYVYTPPGYDSSDKKYPVVYLQHGGGENETGWICQGKISNIMDNLLAEDKCKEMIIVMNTGYSFREDGTSHPLLGTVTEEIVNDAIKYIDSNYRTLDQRENRAMAGLSMGGMQTQRTVFNNPELFSKVGIFSGGFVIKDDYDDYTNIYNDKEEFKKRFDYLFVGCGEQDGFYNETYKNVLSVINSNNLPIEFYHTPGYHDWTFWRHCAYEFLQRVF